METIEMAMTQIKETLDALDPEGWTVDSSTWADTEHPHSDSKKRDVFKSPYIDERVHNGRPFTILGLADRLAFDMDEAGPYYRIRFEDGAKEEFDADPIEIYEGICKGW